MASSLEFPLRSEILATKSVTFGDGDPLIKLVLEFAGEIIDLYIAQATWFQDFGPAPEKGDEIDCDVRVQVRNRGKFGEAPNYVNDLKVSYVQGSARTGGAHAAL